MNPKKPTNLGFLVCLANDWFEATSIGGDAASASGGSEPFVSSAVLEPKVNYRRAKPLKVHQAKPTTNLKRPDDARALVFPNLPNRLNQPV